MKNKKFLVVVVLIIIVGGIFAVMYKPSEINNNDIPSGTNLTSLYKNQEYGFTLNIPKTWEGYIESKTPIKLLDKGDVLGYTIVIRSPKWKENAQTMDIPIQVFTLEQWKKWEANDFEGYPTAAPIGPTERGRNGKYVFATAPRYNFSFATGWEEVDDIIKTLKGI